MNTKNDKKSRKFFVIMVAAMILLAVGGLYLEISKENAREEAEVVANQFADAYFSGDIDGLKMHLAESCSQEAECYQPNAGEPLDVEIVRAKGMQSIKIHNMWSGCHLSVEFLAANDDSLTYLEMDFVREKSGWKIKSYALEK